MHFWKPYSQWTLQKKARLNNRLVLVLLGLLPISLLSGQSKAGGDEPGQLLARPATVSHYSNAEGRPHTYQFLLPPQLEAGRRYPLVVQVFGGNGLQPTDERPFIRVRPTGRGVWGYRSMSRYDVLQAIACAMNNFDIDEDRVYLTGTSAGATGAMHVAAQRPDIFAGVVPLVAFGNDLPLENFCNLPIRCEHGINDWTSAIGNVRVQFQKLRKAGYDAVLNEHPTAGHGIRVPPPKTMNWLFRQKRNRSPQRLVYSCEHPRDGRAWWVRIDEFVDPHRVARVEATVTSDGVHVNTHNVARLSFDRETIPAQPSQQVTIDGDALALSAGRHKWAAFGKGEKWQRSRVARSDDRRAYGAGAAAGLFQGEPLLVVYGTGGDAAENQFLRAAAAELARSGGPAFKPAAVRFPMRSDVEVTPNDQQKHNLLIIGTPENHSLLKAFAPSLPLRISDGSLNAGDREPLPLQNSVLSFHYFNPTQVDRMIYVVSPYLTGTQHSVFLRNPRHFLAGSAGFKMIDQPDLIVRRPDLRICREMQLNSDWTFVSVAGADQPIPKRFSDRTHLGSVYTKVMQSEAGVDFAFWWGPEDKGRFGGYDFNWLPAFDPEHYTQADYSVRRRETETMTASLSGSEMANIFRRWIATREIITWPVVRQEEISEDRTYRIVIPMDLVPKLGDRHRTLAEPGIGPSIMPNQIADEIFLP